MKKKLALVCPVYNEESTLEKSVNTLINYSRENLSNYDWYICIVDNASTDSTEEIAKSLKQINGSSFHYIRLPQKGKGLAVRTAWMNEDFDFSIYMDIDLSTQIDSILPTLALLESGKDLVVASRKLINSKVVGRPYKRELTSSVYIFIAKLMASIGSITDFQCGFKGINKNTAINVLPSIVDNTWYFDSELIINTHKLGYDIAEIPVVWIDDPSTTVKIKKVTQVLLLGLYRNLSEKSWQTGGRPKNLDRFYADSFFDYFIESIKFLGVGTFCFIVDMIIASVYLYFAPDVVFSISILNNIIEVTDTYIAVSLGFVLSVPINFYLNRTFTFQRNEEKVVTQLLKFIPVLVFGILIKVASAYVWTDLLGLYKILAVPFSSGVMLISNYFGHKFITFRKNTK